MKNLFSLPLNWTGFDKIHSYLRNSCFEAESLYRVLYLYKLGVECDDRDVLYKKREGN